MVRPYILRGESDLLAVCRLVEEAAKQWIEDFFSVGSVICAECMRAEEYENTALLSQKDCIYVTGSEGNGVWIIAGSEVLKRIGSSVFGSFNMSSLGSEKPPLVATATLNKILVDLPTRLLHRAYGTDSQQQVRVTSGPLPKALTQHASGALMIELTIPDRILLLVESELASVLIGKNIKKKDMVNLDDPMESISTQYIELQAWLGEAELDLGTLQTISEGDVIKLNMRIDDLVRVRSIDGQTVCQGFLGFQGEHKALQLKK